MEQAITNAGFRKLPFASPKTFSIFVSGSDDLFQVHGEAGRQYSLVPEFPRTNGERDPVGSLIKEGRQWIKDSIGNVRFSNGMNFVFISVGPCPPHSWRGRVGRWNLSSPKCLSVTIVNRSDSSVAFEKAWVSEQVKEALQWLSKISETMPPMELHAMPHSVE